MIRRVFVALAFFLLPVIASAQSNQNAMQFSGALTPGHALKIITNGVVGDAGGAAGGPPGTGLAELGITNPGIGFCQNSGPTTAGYLALCWGFVNGVPTLSENAYGGAAQQPFNIIQNGVTYPLVGTGSANVVAPTSPAIAPGDFIQGNGGTTIADAGYGPSSLPVINVLQHGAKGDGTTDDTAAIQAILNTGTGPIEVYLPGTSACYKISAALSVPNVTVNGFTGKRSVYFVGDGTEHTEILQTSATADAIDLSFGATPPGGQGLWSGGGVHGMTIAAGPSCLAPGINPATVNSTGTAINIQNGNNAIHVSDVFWKGFGTGINLDQTWQGYFDHLWGYGDSIGIQIGCNSAFGQGAGNHFSHILLSNDSFNPSISSTALGIKQCSGGDYFSQVELDGFYNGVMVQPGSGELVEGDSLNDIIVDSSLSDGAVLNGNSGSIGATRIANSWFGFNNGAGLVIKGVTGSGTGVNGVSIVGSHFRENGLAGIDDQINAELVVTGSDFTGNERGEFSLASAGVGCQPGDLLTLQGGTQPSGNNPTTLSVGYTLTGGALPSNGFSVNSAGFYSSSPTGTVSVTGGHCTTEPTFLITDPDQYNPGVHISSGVSGWSFVGNFFGNFATNSLSQASDIAIDPGASTGTYRGNTTAILPPNDGLAYVQNQSTAHINWDDLLPASTGGTGQAAGATFYLGPGGVVNSGSPGQGGFLAPPGVLTEMLCGTAQTPGASQTYTFQPYVTGVGSVGSARAITNGNNSTGDVPQAYQLADGQGLEIQGIYSSGAATSTASCRIGIAH